MIASFNRDGKPVRYVSGHNTTPEMGKRHRAIFASRPDAKHILSHAGKKAWSDPAYRERMAESVKRQWADPAFREKTLSAERAGIRAKWKDDGKYRAKMSAIGRSNMKALRSNPETYARIQAGRSRRLRELWRTPEWVAKIKATHANQCGTVNESKPEKRLRALLRSIGEEILTDKRFVLSVGYTIPDAYIPSLKLAIFTDGTYWHGKPSKKQRDFEQRSDLNRMGIHVFVIDQGKAEYQQFCELIKEIERLDQACGRHD